MVVFIDGDDICFIWVEKDKDGTVRAIDTERVEATAPRFQDFSVKRGVTWINQEEGKLLGKLSLKLVVLEEST